MTYDSKKDAKRLAVLIAKLADDKKSNDIVALDVSKVANFTDFFVICTGGTARQVKAIQDSIREGVKDEFGILPARTEGAEEHSWLLLDYGDCVVHIMQPDVRSYYRLEELWQDGDALKLEFAERPAQATATFN